MKIYAASPFFDNVQLATLEEVEAVLESFDNVDVFKPRNGAASAKKLNKDIGAGKDPSAETRKAVFQDNVDNIFDADLVVAVIDGRDVGTLFELGAAYARNIPIITFTNANFGMNLMLAESTLAHCKGTGQLREAIGMFLAGATPEELEVQFKRANLAEGKDADKKMDLYRKGE